MTKAKNWSFQEIEALVMFVRDNKSELFGTACHSSASVEKIKAIYWQRAADLINAIRVEKRKWQMVRKKWQDLASAARKYNLEKTKTGEFATQAVFMIVGLH